MNTSKILAELRAERDTINAAIAALERLGAEAPAARAAATRKAPVARRGRRGRRHMSAAARKRISEMMKLRWAERKKKAKA